MATDIEKIAQNANFSVEDIRKIKNHIFFDKHDYTLLKHELLEKSHEDAGMDHSQAHILATKKYNYSREAREYYAEINKHKKE
jgi:hypothetical protein